MSNTNTGGPAFPLQAYEEWGGDEVKGCPGMTLRDYFAAKAMLGMYASETFPTGLMADTATEAYQMADAMIAARSTK